MVECRTRDVEVPSSNPGVDKKKISHRSNQKNTINPSAPELKYLKLLEVKTRSQHGTVVEYRTRDPEVPSSNPRAGKKKISQSPTRTIPPPIPLHQNTWNCQSALATLREQNGYPPNSQTYPLYEHIWWYKQDKAKRDCMTPLPRCALPGQGPCQGVISQQVEQVVPVTVPGQGLLLELLEQRITWPGQILRTHQSPLCK